MQISIGFLVNVTREITNNLVCPFRSPSLITNNLVFPLRSPSFISNTMRKIKV